MSTTSVGNAHATPTPHDNAPTGKNDNNQTSSEPVKYYLVFVALIVCFAGLCIFLFLRRRRQRRTRWATELPQDRAPTDTGELQAGRSIWDTWSPDRRRYWGPMEAEDSAEEGLDEHGYAPPPYRPKTSSGQTVNELPAVPEPVFSREEVAYKLPDYSETPATPMQARPPPGDNFF